VVHKGELREKPESAEEARRFIKSYSEAPASTIGACVCTCLDTGTVVEDLDICEIHMDPVPDDVVEALIEEGGVFACAGGLTVEHPLVQPLVTKIVGTS
jgi:septum formation protein